MAKTRDSQTKKDVVTLARERFKQAEDTDHDQLERELADLRFYADDQWPSNIIASRQGQSGGNGTPAIPARPYLVINKLRDPIRHVEAEAQQTDLAPEIVPADDFAGLVGPIDDTEIELREGLVRRIQRESSARDARNWAASRARIAGRGYYVVMTRYCSNRSMDQEVYVSGLYNQSSVRLDPSHEQADGSDAEWGFYGTKLSWGAYKADYPDRASAPKGRTDKDADAEEWRGLGDEAPDWFTGEGDTRFVRVMNYFYTEREAITLVQIESGELVDSRDLTKADTVAKDEDGERIERRDVEKTIKFAKIDGAQMLDETEWESPFIPIIKVVGEELQPYDTQRRYQGMVRPARDAQFGFDVMATTEVEVALLAPKTPIVAYAGQFEGFEDAWDQANVRNIGRLEVNAKTEQTPPGQILPPPQPLVRNTDIGTWDGLRNMFDQAIRATTGVPDATLGNVDPSVRSGRGIRALQDAASQGTSGYLANLVKSVTYEAKIINSLLYPIYGRRPGRMLQMMTGKHESTGVIVGQPFVRDAKQRPVPYDQQTFPDQQPKQYGLTEDATFNVAIRVSKDYDTRRQEEASTLGELINANPQLMTWFGDLFFENQDGPGHKDMAERAKLMLAPPILASLNKDKGQQIPPEVQAQMQQMQAQLQQAQQFIQTKQAEQQGSLQEAQIKAQADMQKAQVDAQRDVQIEQLKADLAIRLKEMDNAKAIEVARINSANDTENIAQEAAEERLSTGLEYQQEHELLEHQSAVSQVQQGAQMSHEAQLAQDAAERAAQQPNGSGA